MTATLTVTIVNHLAIGIACPPESLWREIVASFAEGQRWRDQGYAVEPLGDERAAVLGGYTMRREGDERVVHLSERDEAARRLSLFVDFVSLPAGVQVLASYESETTAGGGCRYRLDCHTRMGMDDDSPDLPAAMAQAKAGFDRHLASYLDTVKSRLEAAAPGDPR